MGHPLADDFGKSFQHGSEFFFGGAADALADTCGRERADLADLDPGSFGQFGSGEFKRQREAGSRFLTGERDGDDRSGTFVEDVVAEDQDRAPASLFVTAHRAQVSPTNFASQYSGHSSPLAARPSSAARCSSAGSSLAHSRAHQVPAKPSNF